jgi:CBS domain-containing protein
MSIRVFNDNDLMYTKPTLTIEPELSIYIYHQMMLMVGVRRLPVVEGRKLVGIISNSDILKNIVS